MDVATESIEEAKQAEEVLEPAEKELSAEESAQQSKVEQMYKELRNWAIMSLILGAASVLVVDVLDPAWGVVMIVIAILAWRVKLPGMLVLFSVLMAWAAVTNAYSALSNGDILWLPLSLLQVYWMYSILKRWKAYSQLPLRQLHDTGVWPADLPPPQDKSAIMGWFAIGGLALGVVALVLFPTVFVLAVVLAAIGGPLGSPSVVSWVIAGAIDIGVLALGLSLAALLSRREKRGWAIGGVVASALALVAWVVFLLV